MTEKAQGESGEQAAAADTSSAERQGDDAAGHVLQGGLCVYERERERERERVCVCVRLWVAGMRCTFSQRCVVTAVATFSYVA